MPKSKSRRALRVVSFGLPSETLSEEVDGDRVCVCAFYTYTRDKENDDEAAGFENEWS